MLYCKVCLNVFLKRLRHGKLRAPLAVVAFVVSQYAGAADAGGKLLPIHLLHGFQFKEPRAGVVARNYIFRKLRIGACGGAEGGLQLFAEEHKRARVLLNIGRAYAENRPACFLFAKHPFYKRLKGQWVHSFAHFMFLPLLCQPLSRCQSLVETSSVLAFSASSSAISSFLSFISSLPAHIVVRTACRPAEKHMPIYILCREGGEGLVIHHYNVRACARLYYAQLMGEILGGNLSVVCEKHCCNFVPANVWHGGVVPLYGQGGFKAFPAYRTCMHRCRVLPICPFQQLQHRRAAHGIAHVRFGVVHNHCAGFANYVHFRGAYVYAVPKQRLFAQNAVVH